MRLSIFVCPTTIGANDVSFLYLRCREEKSYGGYFRMLSYLRNISQVQEKLENVVHVSVFLMAYQVSVKH